ncbi:4'-phosphopantetheinyl transferase family protein [Streptomyces sp. NPDC060194]|uniref:4'-phosphopantetheinyl transferase family protein n=1 Tax=Streptomyces sp. NPDC060194 TaxID=3347069 RepID=UPI0036462E74
MAREGEDADRDGARDGLRASGRPAAVGPVAVGSAVTVAVADTRDVLALPGADPSILTPAESLRLAAARTRTARADFVAARFLVRLCAAHRTGGTPRDVVLEQRCPHCGGPHGRPRVAGMPAVRISLSYADGVVAAAAADRPVGIDVERLRDGGVPGPGIRTLRRFVTPGEVARIRGSPVPAHAVLGTWVRKEALVKASGDGLPAMAGLDLSALPVAPCAGGGPYRIRVPGRREPYDLTDLAGLPPAVAGAVAVVAPAVPDRTPALPATRCALSPDLDEPFDTPSHQGDTP